MGPGAKRRGGTDEKRRMNINLVPANESDTPEAVN
jgi:hypothetical protein